MTTYTVSIGTLSIKIRSEIADGKSQSKAQEKEVAITIDWRALRQAWQAAKVYSMERLRNLLIRYENYQKEKHEQFMANWPPHSLFCEKRCCNKSFTTYHRFLKKELVWTKSGHLK